jgi:hypothetical protein
MRQHIPRSAGAQATLRAAALCLAFWSGIALSAEEQQAEKPAPKIEVEPAELNMGITYAGDVATGSFKIWNRGDAPLIISDIKRSCGCTVVALKKEQKTIPPGKFTSVEVKLKPKGVRHNVLFKRSVTVLSNDPENGRLRYPVSTTLYQPIDTQPGKLSFLDVEPGQTITQKITLTSTTGDVFAINAARLPEGPIWAKFDQGVEGTSHQVELVIGPVGQKSIIASCHFITTHPRMKDVTLPLRMQPIKLVTVEPRTLMLGKVSPGTTITKQMRFIPAAGHTIEHAEFQVQRYSMIKATASKAAGTDNLWNVAFRIPIELAGKTIATRVDMTTNIENAGPLGFNLNARVDSSVDLAPAIPAGF